MAATIVCGRSGHELVETMNQDHVRLLHLKLECFGQRNGKPVPKNRKLYRIVMDLECLMVRGNTQRNIESFMAICSTRYEGNVMSPLSQASANAQDASLKPT